MFDAMHCRAGHVNSDLSCHRLKCLNVCGYSCFCFKSVPRMMFVTFVQAYSFHCYRTCQSINTSFDALCFAVCHCMFSVFGLCVITLHMPNCMSFTCPLPPPVAMPGTHLMTPSPTSPLVPHTPVTFESVHVCVCRSLAGSIPRTLMGPNPTRPPSISSAWMLGRRQRSRTPS